MRKNLAFDNIEVEKRKCHYSKHPIDRSNINFNKIMISSIVSFGRNSFKYFISCKDDEKVKPL